MIKWNVLNFYRLLEDNWDSSRIRVFNNIKIIKDKCGVFKVVVVLL